jgi:hypothetical protein
LTKVGSALDADERVVPAEMALITDDTTRRVIGSWTCIQTGERETPFGRRATCVTLIFVEKTWFLNPL